MRIVLDMQGAQTESRFRGIGRYTLSLAQAIARNRGEHEVILALSGLFPDTIESLRAAFDGLLPQNNICVWYAPGPVRERNPENKWRREVAECIREAFLARLCPDVVHVSSLFEGEGDDAVTSIGVFAPQLPTAVTLYDLIPLFNPELYLQSNLEYARYYHRKIEHIKKAKCWLAISESAADEGRSALSLPAGAVVNISTACDKTFFPMNISQGERRQFIKRFGITKPFVLYSGGADHRKNLKCLVKAYAELAVALRDTHQLVLAGKIFDDEKAVLRRIAEKSGLKDGQMIFSDYVSDEDLCRFYNLCEVFVLPSLHEGFGLPALEAMSCGAAVIGSNATSIPEVIGRQDAMFDPRNETDISRKLAQVLEDASFRSDLAAFGLQRVKLFSWDESAKRAIAAFEDFFVKEKSAGVPVPVPDRRPKLAYVSPLPPARSGIADYSAELLPELARYYDIAVVVAQQEVCDDWIQSNCQIRNPEWLLSNAHRMDRVLYHIGNSPFHQHIFDLLEKVPGVVVLHDFFLSSLLCHLELEQIAENVWSGELYHSHGYSAIRDRYRCGYWADTLNVVMKYPANLRVLQHAQGVIVHSEYSRRLADEWYGKKIAADWEVIPLLRTPSARFDRSQIRAALGIEPDTFLVCSFGLLAPTKQNERLLEAWLASALCKDKHCHLVFVGENDGGEYGAKLTAAILRSGLSKRIRITGWADAETFRHYLVAADMAVQLRTLSRGETSAAVLDCMNHGIPTITNANGSFADLPPDAVWMLPDAFEDGHLVEALETLWRNGHKRTTLSELAYEKIRTYHAPQTCARQYVEAIEKFYACARCDADDLVKAIADIDDQPLKIDCKALAQAIAKTLPGKRASRQLLLDVSATCRTDLKTGIERVTRAIVLALLDAPPSGYRVEPVYLSNDGGAWHYRYARCYTLGLLGCPLDLLADDTVEPQNGDVLIGLDNSGSMLIEAEMAGLHSFCRNIGVAIYFVVFDLLPVLRPEFFPPGADASHSKWLQTISKFDGAVCISKAVADDLASWLNKDQQGRGFGINWFHLGADVQNSAPSWGIPENAAQILNQFNACPTFLMVGTIEPRKGYLQTIEAFERLWQEGFEVNLVIVGKEGWKGLPENFRRTIPDIVGRLLAHPELNKRLFWLEGISDEYLEKVYAASTCLIAASEGEGFGLPLIEAAQHKLPIIARNIPVFHEVAGDHAFYFFGLEPDVLAAAVQKWLALYHLGSHPKSDDMPWLTWRQSAQRLLTVILNGQRDGAQMFPSACQNEAFRPDSLNLDHSKSADNRCLQKSKIYTCGPRNY